MKSPNYISNPNAFQPITQHGPELFQRFTQAISKACNSSLFFFLCMLLQNGGALSQPPMHDRAIEGDQIQALRIGFFVQELELTAEESIEFWPAWNEVEERMKGHRELIRDLERRISGASTDDEARQLAAEMKAMKIQGLDLQDAGLEQMSEVIGYRRAAQIEQIERAFRSRLLKKRMNGRNAGDPGPKRKF